MGDSLKNWNFSGNGEVVRASSNSIRGVISKLRQSVDERDNRPIIPLGHGDPASFPCFRTAPIAEEAVVETLRSSKFNSYSTSFGLFQTRRAIASYLSRDLPWNLSPDDVYVTVGCQQAIEITLTSIARTGSNILLPRPGYPHYDAHAVFNHLEVRRFDLVPESGWEVDLDSVRALADENTVAMVIINPGNPCGNVHSYDHLQKVAETARDLGILVVADEVYGHIVFGDKQFVPMAVFASRVPVLTLGSMSKRWVIPGWRMGWLVVCDPNGILRENGIVECIRSYCQISSDPTSFIQAAVPRILESTEDEYFDEMNGMLKENADICYRQLMKIPCMECPSRAEGSMFLMVRLNLSLMRDVNDDADFCGKLAEEESVIVLPGSALGLVNWVRITFAVETSVLVEGLGRIKSFCLSHCCVPPVS